MGNHCLRWLELDANGHVNNCRYLEYFQEIRIMYLVQAGLLGVERFVVAHNSCDYFKPLFYPDNVIVKTKVTVVGDSSVTMIYEAWSENEKYLAATGVCRYVCIDHATSKKKPLSKEAVELFEKFENRSIPRPPKQAKL